MWELANPTDLSLDIGSFATVCYSVGAAEWAHIVASTHLFLVHVHVSHEPQIEERSRHALDAQPRGPFWRSPGPFWRRWSPLHVLRRPKADRPAPRGPLAPLARRAVAPEHRTRLPDRRAARWLPHRRLERRGPPRPRPHEAQLLGKRAAVAAAGGEGIAARAAAGQSTQWPAYCDAGLPLRPTSAWKSNLLRVFL